VATVFSANMNVFTADPVTPLSNDVISWEWRDYTQTEDAQRAQLRREAAESLRRFRDGTKIAAAYVDAKVLLPCQGRLAPLRAVQWAVDSVRHADRVLLGASPSGVDRLLWVTAYVTAKLARRPIYLYSEVWTEPRGWRNWTTRQIQRLLRRDAECVLVPSRIHRVFNILSGVPADRVLQIPSIYCPRPPRRQLLRERRSISSHAPTMLYVGRLVPVKGLHRLLQVTDRLAASGKIFRLVVVIPRAAQYMGRDKAYAARCRELLAEQPPARTEILSHIEYLESAFSMADLLVVPNVVLSGDRVPAESWGRVVEEALFHGVPVISTDAVPAARELVVDGVNGRVVPWEDDQALERAISEALA
jgi:glycosyltransferase involved in cell wall biosynthesis